ncbi:urea ABC transporter permease subunit UrtC [Brevifollis gellanilyticus]|uniref:Branched-chain amino acid ABC transporter permease n=1 Tax=Brevifollis gellanilyticus TaxID=748831 RepID=A0A512M2X0_9BACT|nr:urea ABC transporter permease subunit UrtC [Brevifollis gellanilyticus]GEP41082.1 branched-chain amino acid ABC transporter permease [Brevifollis gellanilyticus]
MTHSLLVRPIAKREWSITAAVAFFLIVLMPLMNSLGWISDFTINLWGKYLCYAMLAISVDLLWGYTGLLSLGQALFFTLGGYMMGMYLMRMIGDMGQYHKDMPDFLVFLGWERLPTFWKPFSSFPFAMIMMLLIPGIVAYVFGWLAFRSRVRGVYFSILTQALTYGASLMFFRNDMLMGGNNGFTDFRFILGYDIRSPGTQRGLFIITAIVLSLTYAGLRCLTRSRFGLVQQAVRDSENRVLFSGYSSPNFKLFIFVLSALIGSIGGALYVPQVGIINPSEMTTDKSLEAVVWTAVGGRGTLIGPIVGAVSVNALKSWATRAYPDLWLIILGGLFMLVVLFLPKGIVGVPGMVKGWLKSRKPPEEPDSIPLTKVADKAE